ncbi:arginase family protein [Halovenus sp. HT40]|uniref:arginase family protein n=1 Tax=Halovenus sp. HT40 TaxID=3126691 RepID=UPI00300F49ED
MVRNSEWGQEDPTATDAECFGDIIESTTPADAGEYDVVLLGEPYDGGTTGRAGARAAPAAIRDALDGVETHHLDAGPVDSVGDLGTVAIPASASVSTARERVRATVDELHDADTVPIILGGSGSLTYANVAGLLEATAVTDGSGEQIEDLRSSSEPHSDGGYVTDGGFGEDEESVGDVEHFDPTGDEETTEDESEDSADSEVADGEETDETEKTDDSEVDEAEADGDEAESAADDESTEDAEPGSETDDEEPEEDETAEDTDMEEDDEPEDEGEEVAEDEDNEQEADETVEESNEAMETPEDEEMTEPSDEEAATDDAEAESAVDDTAFAMPDSEAETEVIEESTASPDTDADTATSATNSVGVISLDARLDCRPVDGGPTNRNGYRQLFETGVDALAVLGARHFESSTTEAEYLRDRNGMVVTAEEVGDDPVEAADRALGAMEEVEQIYVSIDLSVLDSATAPAVSDPAPGGLSTRELFRVVRLLASDDRIAGFELVEAVPALDRDGRTVDAAARTVAHAVATVGE